jgi:hypothetical protein
VHTTLVNSRTVAQFVRVLTLGRLVGEQVVMKAKTLWRVVGRTRTVKHPKSMKLEDSTFLKTVVHVRQALFALSSL